jgi:hypothetical protein
MLLLHVALPLSPNFPAKKITKNESKPQVKADRQAARCTWMFASWALDLDVFTAWPHASEGYCMYDMLAVLATSERLS